MNAYQVTLLRVGHVVIWARDENEAACKAARFPEKDIQWLTDKDNPSALWQATAVELLEPFKMEPK